jgi:hypothetical protein
VLLALVLASPAFLLYAAQDARNLGWLPPAAAKKSKPSKSSSSSSSGGGGSGGSGSSSNNGGAGEGAEEDAEEYDPPPSQPRPFEQQLSRDEQARTRPMRRVLEFLLPKGTGAVLRGGRDTMDLLAAGSLVLTNKGHYIYNRVRNVRTSGECAFSCDRRWSPPPPVSWVGGGQSSCRYRSW